MIPWHFFSISKTYFPTHNISFFSFFFILFLEIFKHYSIFYEINYNFIFTKKKIKSYVWFCSLKIQSTSPHLIKTIYYFFIFTQKKKKKTFESIDE